MTSDHNIWIEADWPAPEHVRAGTTVRKGGCSQTPFDELNLAQHVEDKTENVLENRRILTQHLNLPSEPVWLNQTHSSRIIHIDSSSEDSDADASYATQKNTICAVMTADCVPVLFCNKEGDKIAAIHAGWKGICAGILENAVQTLNSPETLIAWIGPCISAANYEVGRDVFQNCLNHSELLSKGFEQTNPDHWLCDLVEIVKILLKNCRVGAIYECNLCTHENAELFYSYRRDGITGRTASLVWME